MPTYLHTNCTLRIFCSSIVRDHSLHIGTYRYRVYLCEIQFDDAKHVHYWKKYNTKYEKSHIIKFYKIVLHFVKRCFFFFFLPKCK